MALSAKDVRPGNWVYDKHLKETYQVTENLYHLIGNWEPIPLTKDCFVKFGWKDMSNQENGFAKHIWFEFPTRINGEIFKFIIDVLCKKGGYVWWGKNTTSLDYVHQLQNLYQALTQKEQEIKEFSLCWVV